MRVRTLMAITVALAIALAACGSESSPSSSKPSKGGTVTLVAHDSFLVSKPVLRAFERQSGLKVKVLKNGDAGAALNQAILTKGAPLGDVFFGVDNTFLTRALAAGIFVPYSAKGLDRVPTKLQLDPTHHITPIDAGDVCVNFDKAWFAREGIPLPKTLDDLAKPAYKGRLAVENPATSSPGLAFLLATVARYGENGWQGYWKRLRANGVKVVDGWEQAYNAEFSGAAGKGAYPLVVSYASSPPAEVYFADPQPAEAPTGTLTGTCFRQVEFAGVLKGAAHPDAAKRVIDFMLTERFQADVPLQMWVFPARTGTPLPPVFVKFAAVPSHPFAISAAAIGKHRDAWIRQWTTTVLR